MADVSIYKCKPRQIKGFVEDCLYAGLVPYVQSSPGMGKSSIMRNVASGLNLKLIDHRLSTSAPEDLSGLPRFSKDGFAEFVPFAELFPVEQQEIPVGKDGWMLFLDEFNSASKGVQAACYKLILDRMTGQKKLHDRVVIAAAGNLSTDKAITNPISTAMQSRVVHLEMEVCFKEWLEDVAITETYDPRIIAYLSQYNSKLMDFDPNHNEKTFCCPRTWEFVNKLIRDKQIDVAIAPLLAGTITSGVAVDFIQFTRVFANMVSYQDIMRDPMSCPIPQDNATRWAVISSITEKVTEHNLENLAKYANRFSMDFRILFFRTIMIRQKALRHHPAFINSMTELSRYLYS